jgi:hypothetical protein
MLTPFPVASSPRIFHTKGSRQQHKVISLSLSLSLTHTHTHTQSKALFLSFPQLFTTAAIWMKTPWSGSSTFTNRGKKTKKKKKDELQIELRFFFFFFYYYYYYYSWIHCT